MGRRGLVGLALVALLGCGGTRLEDRTQEPALPGSALEVVAELDYPPGNIAVARDGRIFFTLHPAGDPPLKLAELVNGKPAPFPDMQFQKLVRGAPSFDSPLAVRIDRQNRLWVLDFARYGRGAPRLLAFDLGSRRLVHRYDFPSAIAGLLSMVNDFQVAPDGKTIYIAETSPILQRPALVVYDVDRHASRRLLQDHVSVEAKRYILQAPGRDMKILGVWPILIGVDSITLDDRGEYLYYGPFSGDRLYRIATAALRDPSLSRPALEAKVEDLGPKTLSDGLSIDAKDTVYISDPEHSAVLTVGPDRTLKTLVKDARLRWPDGFSFGPDGWLYVTCSALHQVMFTSAESMESHRPYQVFRFKPGTAGEPGH